MIGAGLDEAEAHQALDVAERLGITIIDTAYSYAAGASQEMIGSWLAADPDRVSRMTIVDKVGSPSGTLSSIWTSRRIL